MVDELLLFRHFHQHIGEYISLSLRESARSYSNMFEAPKTRIVCELDYFVHLFCFRNERENKALWLESIYLYIDRHIPYIFTLISHLIYYLSVRQH